MTLDELLRLKGIADVTILDLAYQMLTLHMPGDEF